MTQLDIISMVAFCFPHPHLVPRKGSPMKDPLRGDGASLLLESDVHSPSLVLPSKRVQEHAG